MAQVKIYALKTALAGRRAALSACLHECMVEVLGLPADKRFHRFIALEAEDFIYPAPRSEAYTILEVHLMAGRSQETRKRLVRTLFERFAQQLGIVPQDLEISLIESEAANWGFRGLCGDEAILNYTIKV